MKTRSKHLIIFLIYLTSGTMYVYSQKTSIRVLKSVNINQKLYVTYQFINPDNSIYSVYGEVIDSTYKITPIRFATGHFNETLGDSSIKELIIPLDSNQIQNSVMLVKLYCKKYRILGGPENALLSIVLPGTGDFFVYKRYYHAPLIMATYATFIFTGLANHSKYKSYYSDYKNLKIQSEIDLAYTNASKYADKSRANFTIAAIVLATDVSLVCIKGHLNNKVNRRLRSKLGINKPDFKRAFVLPVINKNHSSVCVIYNF